MLVDVYFARAGSHKVWSYVLGRSIFPENFCMKWLLPVFLFVCMFRTDLVIWFELLCSEISRFLCSKMSRLPGVLSICDAKG